MAAVKVRLRILRNKLGTILGATVNGSLLPSVLNLKLDFDSKGVPVAQFTVNTPDINFETIDTESNKIPADYGKAKTDEEGN
jgi:hypothetical protein